MQAVIGAGAAGLAAARELVREGHDVTVLEQASYAGGVWQLDERIEEEDLLGLSQSRTVVHSSMYETVRTNLPREVMGFSDLPFVPSHMAGRSEDDRQYCGYEEVLRYLLLFLDTFNLNQYIQYNTKVVDVRPSSGASSNGMLDTRWTVKAVLNSDVQPDDWQPRHSDNGLGSILAGNQRGWAAHSDNVVKSEASNGNGTGNESDLCNDHHVADVGTSGGQVHEEQYDAVMVCNGHYTVPNIPSVSGLETFPGTCMHSHNYRRPDPFKGLNVVLVGASISGGEIAVDISTVARSVSLCAKSWAIAEWADNPHPYGPRKNITRRAMLQALEEDGSAILDDGTRLQNVDVVMFCTGYKYDFPFLREHGVVDTTRGHVQPLYQHLFTPAYGASLSFIGLPFKVVPFPQFELQSKLVARVLAGRATLPSRTQMEIWSKNMYSSLEAAGVIERHYHKLGSVAWDYNDWLASMCGSDVPLTTEWRKELSTECSQVKRKFPDAYREMPHNAALLQAAYAEFKQIDSGRQLLTTQAANMV